MLVDKLSFLTFFLILVTLSEVQSTDCPNNGRKVVCYFSSWAFYRPSNGQFDVRYINPHLCTHYIYAFAGIDRHGKIYSLDNKVDLDFQQYQNFTNLKLQNPCIKTMVAIGGWNEGSIKFSIMASTPESRNRFVEDMLRFLAYYNFDGLDLDWEYPGARGGMKEDKENFIDLLESLHERFQKWGFELSMAVPINKQLIEDGYLIESIAKYVDFVSIMAYDFTPADSPVTGLLSPFTSIKESVDLWLSHNMPPEKLILGVAAYARSFYLKDVNDNGIGAATNGSLGRQGEYTNEDGFLSFFEMESFVNLGLLSEHKVDENYYAVFDNEWFTYDKIDTYKVKAQYAKDQNLGGVMLWSLDTDDFNGYSGINEYYKVLKAIREFFV